VRARGIRFFAAPSLLREQTPDWPDREAERYKSFKNKITTKD